MRLCLIICASALAACGADPGPIPPELLMPCPGWSGRVPQTEGELIRASLAERLGRECANDKIATLAQIAGPQ